MTYESRMEQVHKALAARQYELSSAESMRADAQERSDAEERKLLSIEEAVKIVQTLASNMHNTVRGKIVSIVQMALDAVGAPYRFDMEFVSRRDKTEVDMCLVDVEGNRQGILDSSGGGVSDVVSFALRVAVWSLDRSAASVILLDEPFKFLSRGLRHKGAELLQVLGESLGLQFIIVSHVPEIIDCADVKYVISKNGSPASKAEKL